MGDQSTDNDQSPSGNPNMAVQKDAKPVRDSGLEGTWTEAVDNDQGQKSIDE